MAESILVAIILVVWIILGKTLGRDSALRRIFGRASRLAAGSPPLSSARVPQPSATPIDKTFRCDVELAAASLDTRSQNFSVAIRGRIRVPAPMYETQVQILLADITDGPEAAEPVLCVAREWQLEGSPAFCYKAPNGRIPAAEYVLSDWLQVASIPLQVLRFPRRGSRKLQCITSLLSLDTADEIACASVEFEFQNRDLGYVDARENAEQSEILTLQLAVAVGSAAAPPRDAAIAAIEQWIDSRLAHDEDQRDSQRHVRLAAVLRDARDACASGGRLDIEKICSLLRSVATIVDVYDAMRLCLRTISAAGAAERAQTALISRIAQALCIDESRFRAMSQKILPVALQKERDLEFILGITPGMDPALGRRRLRDEYQKWNARVTHPDPKIQAQADEMLALIAEARNRLFDEVPANS